MKVAIWRLAQGIGGSETSLIELARFLQLDMKYQVTVYADMSNKEILALAGALGVTLTDMKDFSGDGFDAIFLYGSYVTEAMDDAELMKIPVRILVVGGYLDCLLGDYYHHWQTHILVKAEQIKDWILAKLDKEIYFTKAALENIFVAQFPIDLEYWSCPGRNYNRPGQVRVGNIGRITDGKGVHKLIDLFNIIRPANAELVLYEYISDKCELDRPSYQGVTIRPGRCPAKPLYQDLDIFVMLSEREGTPRVLMEAMAMGLPIITTDVGGIPDLDPQFSFPIGHSDIPLMLSLMCESSEYRAGIGQENRRLIKKYNSRMKTKLTGYLNTII